MGILEAAFVGGKWGIWNLQLLGSVMPSEDPWVQDLTDGAFPPERMLSGQACWVPDTHPSGALFPGIQSIGQGGSFAVVQEDSRGHVPPAISSWVRAELGPF